MNNLKKKIIMSSRLTALSFFSVLLFFASAFLLLNISVDTYGVKIFDLPLKRLVMIALLILFGIVFFVIGIFTSGRHYSLLKIYESIPCKYKLSINIVSTLFVLWGIISLLVPESYFGIIKGYIWLLKFFSIPVSIIIVIIVLAMKVEKKESAIIEKIKNELRQEMIPFILITCVLLLLSAYIYLSKTGLVCDTGYWNVPGIPVSGSQLFVGLIILIIIIISRKLNLWKKFGSIKNTNIIIPIIIYFVTLIIWGVTPLFKHHFSLEPAPPFFQPYPASDARVYDLGAISIIKGYGIYFHMSTDKPLYMVFLAMLHLFAKNDYTLITWIQLIFLSFIPVMLFLIGRKFQGSFFGILLAAITIVQQRNAILLSHMISSVNVKLFVTEEVTLLGILFFAYFFFLWASTKKYKYAVLLGGIVGTLSLIRLNPLVLVPLFFLICYIIFRKQKRFVINNILLFSAGFIFIFTPWIITGVDSNNIPWIFSKFNSVLNERIIDMTNTSSYQYDTDKQNNLLYIENSLLHKDFGGYKDIDETNKIVYSGVNQNIIPNNQEVQNFVFLFINHFLHNFSTSFLSLPDTPLFIDINLIQQRDYYRDVNLWDGSLPGSQLFFIIINLIIFAIGLTVCWKKFRWIGLIPIFVFVFYDISLSIVMNSGGRYIVPINWIIYFYYLFGIISLVMMVLYILLPSINTQNISMVTIERESGKQKTMMSFIPLVFVASLIPIANTLLPRIIQTQNLEIGNSLIESTSREENTCNNTLLGEILYPYYHIYDGSIMFDLLIGQNVRSYIIERSYITDPNIFMTDQQTALICYSTTENNVVINRIYLLIDDKWSIFWDNSKK